MRIKIYYKFLPICLFLLGLYGCSTQPPRDINDACDIFQEKRSWYKAAKRSEKTWGTPVSVMLAFIHQESRFKSDAKPARGKILWVFPGLRPSSAFGYAQALDATWEEYKQKNNRRGADRDDFDDAVDFIGWYNHNSAKRAKIAKTDAYNLYLAYHEGATGYLRGTHQGKDWLLRAANKVKKNNWRYKQQLAKCESRLQRPGLLRLFN